MPSPLLARSLPTLADRLAWATLRAQGYLSRFVDTSAGRVHALDVRGNGPLPPVVLLHGFSSAGVHYFGLLRRLRDQTRRLVALDLPGHGFSELPEVGLDATSLSHGLIEALDHLIGEPVVLFGNSMGGMAAVRYAGLRPEVVRALVLVSPGGAPMSPAELDRFRASFALRNHAEALEFVDRLLDRPTRLRTLLAWGIRERFHRAAMRDLIASLRPQDLLVPSELARIDCPTLLLWGNRDRILPATGLDFFRDALPPHAWIEEPEGWGHSPYLERPDEVAAWVLRFLEIVDRKEARDAV